MEEERDVECYRGGDESADEIAEDEAGTGVVYEEGERHDGEGDVALVVDEEGDADGEYGEGGYHEGV